MNTVKDLLKGKGNEVWSATADTSVYAALQQMAEKNIGALVVLDADGLIGIFSERDYARKVILKGKASRETPLSEIMTRKPFTVSPDQTLAECMALMTAKHIRHLPVMDGGKLVGVISIGDVVKDIMKDQAETIYWLQEYIKGGR